MEAKQMSILAESRTVLCPGPLRQIKSFTLYRVSPSGVEDNNFT